MQRGRDGFDSAAFAGANAVFCRLAYYSNGGIQYGTHTDDACTGNVVHTSGWDSVYFRKDFEDDAKDRVHCAEVLFLRQWLLLYARRSVGQRVMCRFC